MTQLKKNWMKRRILTTGISIAFSAAAAATCGAQTPTIFGPANPFYAPSTLPFQAPPFDKIKDGDYRPAIDAGMAQQIKEVEAIANNPAPPTFENTLVALERSGQLLNRVMAVFNCVTGANTNDDLQKVQEYEAPRLAAHQDAIYLNAKLFERVKAIYEKRASLGLDPESLRLVEYDYQQFVKAGANLSEADKAKLKKINEEDSTLENAFMNKLLAATKAGAYSTADPKALAGLSEAQMAAAAQDAQARKQQGWVAPLQNTTQQPDLTFLTDRATRKAIFENSWNRAERGDANDTRSTIARLAQLRAEKGALLGFPNFAAWNLTDQMAKTSEAAINFLDALTPAATARAGREAKDIQAIIDSQHGGFTLEPWDWEFYAEQVRKAKYDLDESQVKPYFELNSVLENGVFYAAHELYGLTFKERKDIPVYQQYVHVFEVFDADRQAAGAVVLRLLQARQQERRRVDGCPGRPVEAAGPIAGGVQRGQLREARAGRARAAQLRRCNHDVPRVWPRAAWHVCQHRISQPVGHAGAARFCRVPFTVQRALGQLSGGLCALREALQNRRAHASGAGGED